MQKTRYTKAADEVQIGTKERRMSAGLDNSYVLARTRNMGFLAESQLINAESEVLRNNSGLQLVIHTDSGITMRPRTIILNQPRSPGGMP